LTLSLSLSLYHMDMINYRTKFEKAVGLLDNKPTLSKKTARLFLVARSVEPGFLNYSIDSKNEVEKSVFLLIEKIKSILDDRDLGDCENEFKSCLSNIARKEHTRTSNSSVKEYSRYFASLKKRVFLSYIKDKNNEYIGIREFLSHNKGFTALSLVSKFYFHVSFCCYGDKAHYVKYDSLVREHLYLYCEGLDKNSFDIKPREKAEKRYQQYKKYSDAISSLCVRHQVSRNELDIIIWTYFKEN